MVVTSLGVAKIMARGFGEPKFGAWGWNLSQFRHPPQQGPRGGLCGGRSTTIPLEGWGPKDIQLQWGFFEWGLQP